MTRINDMMVSAVRGYRVELIANGHRDYIVVPCDGIETEEQAIAIAAVAARNGYPVGPIDWKSVEFGRWCPMGLWANEDGTAIWCS